MNNDKNQKIKNSSISSILLTDSYSKYFVDPLSPDIKLRNSKEINSNILSSEMSSTTFEAPPFYSYHNIQHVQHHEKSQMKADQLYQNVDLKENFTVDKKKAKPTSSFKRIANCGIKDSLTFKSLVQIQSPHISNNSEKLIKPIVPQKNLVVPLIHPKKILSESSVESSLHNLPLYQTDDIASTLPNLKYLVNDVVNNYGLPAKDPSFYYDFPFQKLPAQTPLSPTSLKKDSSSLSTSNESSSPLKLNSSLGYDYLEVQRGPLPIMTQSITSAVENNVTSDHSSALILASSVPSIIGYDYLYPPTPSPSPTTEQSQIVSRNGTTHQINPCLTTTATKFKPSNKEEYYYEYWNPNLRAATPTSSLLNETESLNLPNDGWPIRSLRYLDVQICKSGRAVLANNKSYSIPTQEQSNLTFTTTSSNTSFDSASQSPPPPRNLLIDKKYFNNSICSTLPSKDNKPRKTDTIFGKIVAPRKWFGSKKGNLSRRSKFFDPAQEIYFDSNVNNKNEEGFVRSTTEGKQDLKKNFFLISSLNNLNLVTTNTHHHHFSTDQLSLGFKGKHSPKKMYSNDLYFKIKNAHQQIPSVNNNFSTSPKLKGVKKSFLRSSLLNVSGDKQQQHESIQPPKSMEASVESDKKNREIIKRIMGFSSYNEINFEKSKAFNALSDQNPHRNT